jgi:3-oxoacyl-[acyl-carrier protein] reductase
VIANAGVWRGGPVDRLHPDDWSLVLDTSLGGAFSVIRSAAPALRSSSHGRMVVISSVVGLIGFPGDTAYATAKPVSSALLGRWPKNSGATASQSTQSPPVSSTQT